MLRGALLVVLVLGATGTVSAHVPQVGGGGRVIDEPGRSWAFFAELPPDGTHVWTFTLAAGDPLLLGVAVSVGATWTPTASLDGPMGDIPLGAGSGVGLEPFTPYAP